MHIYNLKETIAKTRFLSRPLIGFYLFASFIVAPSFATAEDQVIDILPPATQTTEVVDVVGTTHAPVRLTPDKSELIRLEQDAGSIIIGNPLHINVIADSSKTLVIVPRSPGATHFTILGKNGDVIMQRHVIVASPKQDYVRVKRACREDAENCQRTRVFYCPDMCHEIGLAQQGESSGSDSSSTNSAQNSTASGNTDTESEGNE